MTSLPFFATAQSKSEKKIDSLNQLLAHSKVDTNRARQLAELSGLYTSLGYTLKSKPLADQAIALSKKLNYPKGLGKGYTALGLYYDFKRDTVNAFNSYKTAFILAKQSHDKVNLKLIHDNTEGFMVIRELPSYSDPEKNLRLLNESRRKLAIALFFDDARYAIFAYGKIAQIYEVVKDEKAIQQQHRYALAISKKNGMDEFTVLLLYRLSTSYYNQKDYAQSEKTLQEALAIETRQHLPPQLYNNLIVSYLKQKNYSRALYYSKLALNNPKFVPFLKGPAALSIANLYLEAPDSSLIAAGIDPANRYTEALKNIDYSLSINKITNDKAIQQQTYLTISKIYAKLNEYQKAYDNYTKYTDLKDELNSASIQRDFVLKDAEISFNKKTDSLNYLQKLSGVKFKQQQQALLLNQQRLQLADKDNKVTQANLLAEQNRRKAKEQQLKASQKEQVLANTTVQLQKNEIMAKKTQSYYLIAGIAALLGLSFFIARNYNNQRRANQEISAEKQRSDDLLLNILPADIAEELKQKGSSDARLFDEVTVLFTDFVNFTQLSERLNAKELVNELNVCFKAFDEIMTIHHIEKIKTIGDAYLAVAGLPNADDRHAANTIKAALDIQQFIHDRKVLLGDKTFDIRIGIHSGSVVAGIVGVKKFAYDIWGDTVNTAARMEQNSEPGKINVSQKTYELVKDQFAFTYRGEIEAKNKGALKMFFAEG